MDSISYGIQRQNQIDKRKWEDYPVRTIIRSESDAVKIAQQLQLQSNNQIIYRAVRYITKIQVIPTERYPE